MAPKSSAKGAVRAAARGGGARGTRNTAERAGAAAAKATAAAVSAMSQGGPLGAPLCVALFLALVGRGVSSIVKVGTALRGRVNALNTIPWALMVRNVSYVVFVGLAPGPPQPCARIAPGRVVTISRVYPCGMSRFCALLPDLPAAPAPRWWRRAGT